MPIKGYSFTSLVSKVLEVASDLVSHINNKSNPHAVTKAQVGLSNVNNWSATSSISDASATKYSTASAAKTAYDRGTAGINAANTKLPLAGGTLTGHVNGTSITCSGKITGLDVGITSDRRLKQDIAPIQDALSIVNQLEGVTFNWIESGRPDVGLIAQDVEKVLPEMILEEDGEKSVKYANLVAVLIEANKELVKRVEALEKHRDGLY